jgi:hypothetical protein
MVDRRSSVLRAYFYSDLVATLATVIFPLLTDITFLSVVLFNFGLSGYKDSIM